MSALSGMFDEMDGKPWLSVGERGEQAVESWLKGKRWQFTRADTSSLATYSQGSEEQQQKVAAVLRHFLRDPRPGASGVDYLVNTGSTLAFLEVKVNNSSLTPGQRRFMKYAKRRGFVVTVLQLHL